jgi:hypothetical protein
MSTLILCQSGIEILVGPTVISVVDGTIVWISRAFAARHVQLVRFKVIFYVLLVLEPKTVRFVIMQTAANATRVFIITQNLYAVVESIFG